MATQYDPTTFGYQNFYSALLTGDITSGTLTISLDTVPSPTSGILIIDPDSSTAREIILYTSKGASTITCPSDGRGWGGSTAAAHLTGTTIIMAPIKEFFAGLADGTLSTDPIRAAAFANFVYSGGVVAQSAGLVGTFSNIVFWLNGQRYSGTSIANKTYTASKDTYVDVTAASGGAVSVTYTEVANGATSPALAANYLRIAKVVTSGAAITSVTQSGYDAVTTNGAVNYIYNTSPYSAPTFVYTNAGSAGGTYYYRNQGGVKEMWGLSAANAVNTTPATYALGAPAGFFNGIVSANAGVFQVTLQQSQFAILQGFATTGGTLTQWANSAGTQVASIYIRGY